VKEVRKKKLSSIQNFIEEGNIQIGKSNQCVLCTIEKFNC